MSRSWGKVSRRVDGDGGVGRSDDVGVVRVVPEGHVSLNSFLT